MTTLRGCGIGVSIDEHEQLDAVETTIVELRASELELETEVSRCAGSSRRTTSHLSLNISKMNGEIRNQA
jgi:hypothetical protein